MQIVNMRDPSKLELIQKLEFGKYFNADSWEEYNRQFFDGLAPKYDRLNEILSLGQHRRYKKSAIKSLGIKNGEKILDLCTGSGDLALFVAQRFPDCQVVGLDASEKMLDIARKRGEGLRNVRFIKGDVLDLEFSDNEFDAVLISFGLRNLSDIKEGILEMKRVARPGGRILNLDLGRPNGSFLSWIHKIYFRTFIPFLGKALFHRGEFNSFAYLPTSGQYFPPQDRLIEIFRELGLRDVRKRDYMLGAISQQMGIV